jgi:signal transduction histidine kinase
MNRAPRGFRRQIVVSTMALMALAMLAVGLGIQLLLDRTAQGDIRRALRERADAMVTVVEQASTDSLVVPDGALEHGTWVFDADGTPVAGSVPDEARTDALALATASVATEAPPRDESIRVLAVPFTTATGLHGVVVVTQDPTPYERSEFYAMLATGALGVIVVAATGFMAHRVTRQALEPVTRMAQRATDWSEHDLTHRFSLGPPTNELAALGQTLDHLLDRVASVILSEQRLTAELAHELRTPLTAIRGSADLALMRGVPDEATRADLKQISASAAAMTDVVATLLDVARDRAPRTEDCLVSGVVPELLASVEEHTIVDLTGASTAVVAAPPGLVARALAPLIDNAVRHASTTVTVEATDRAEDVLVVVSDDGHGIDESVRDRIFEPGVSSASSGSGLGLGIARRVARSFGGDVEVVERHGGAAFAVTVPRR